MTRILAELLRKLRLLRQNPMTQRINHPLSFGCYEDPRFLTWQVVFNGPTRIRIPFSWQDLVEMSKEYQKVLVLGVFSWSNYSRGVFEILKSKQSFFESRGIGLALFCLGNDEQIRQICPDLFPAYMQATTEPAMILIEAGTVSKTRLGMIDGDGLVRWVLSGEGGNGVSD